MKNISFTKDEAILALDVLYFSDEIHLTANSEPIQELSNLLRELPIIPVEKRGEIFRNSSGVSKQINSFQRSYPKGIKDKNVGGIFYAVANEFKENLGLLHDIAQAIRYNREFFRLQPFGSEIEAAGFPEGALLSHLHRTIELRDSEKLSIATKCEICQLNLSEVYKDTADGFLQFHLMEPITKLDANKKYSQSDFITVCPNCHAVLHRRRPWATRETIGEILR